MIKDDPSMILKVGTNCGKCIEEAGQKVASKKYMDRLTRPATHIDRTKYNRKRSKKLDYESE